MHWPLAITAALTVGALMLGWILQVTGRQSEEPQRTSPRLREQCGIEPLEPKSHVRLMEPEDDLEMLRRIR